jgi:hypothetical protein
MVQQLRDKDAFFFEAEAEANYQGSTHPDAVSEADGKAGEQIKRI